MTQLEMPLKSYIDKKILNLGYNTVGDNVRLRIHLPSSDKGTAIVFGTHNGTNFLSLLYFNKNADGIGVANLHGTLAISSKQVTGNYIEITFRTNRYGTFNIISDSDISEAYYY